MINKSQQNIGQNIGQCDRFMGAKSIFGKGKTRRSVL